MSLDRRHRWYANLDELQDLEYTARCTSCSKSILAIRVGKEVDVIVRETTKVIPTMVTLFFQPNPLYHRLMNFRFEGISAETPSTPASNPDPTGLQGV